MPIVFVHGVNNRESDDYRDVEAGRNACLREIVAPALGLPPDELHIASPYWGGNAATYAWNMAALPDAAATYEHFGGGDAALDYTLQLAAESPVGKSVADSARKDFGTTVDMVYGAALTGATDEAEARNLARSYLRAAEYAEANPSPDWVAEVTDVNFAGVLTYWADPSPYESFGSGGMLDSLNEGVSRLLKALPAASTDVAGRFGRRKLNATVAGLAGDALVYLVKRGTEETPGPIVRVVLDALRDAETKKTPRDSRLVVIAHSFGGEIIYDILTCFAPQLEVDCLVTVGSQVGLFEELKLFLASDDTIPGHGSEKVARPKCLKRWLNVFDTQDVLSYRACPVFADIDDYKYDSGFSSLHAHSGYFVRPSFYRRLAARLAA